MLDIALYVLFGSFTGTISFELLYMVFQKNKEQLQYLIYKNPPQYQHNGLGEFIDMSNYVDRAKWLVLLKGTKQNMYCCKHSRNTCAVVTIITLLIVVIGNLVAN